MPGLDVAGERRDTGRDRGTRRLRLGVALLVAALLALLSDTGVAVAKPTIGPPVAELTQLVHEGTDLLDAHLSPGLDIPIHIGWQTNAEPSEPSPATTNVATDGSFLSDRRRQAGL